MRQQFQTPPAQDVQVQPDPKLVMLTEYKQLKREEKSLKSRIHALAEDIKTAISEDGEVFQDDWDELYLCPIETATFDYKAAILAGVMTQEQAEPFIKRTISSQLRSRSVTPKSKSPEPGSTEDVELRKRIANASKGLVG